MCSPESKKDTPDRRVEEDLQPELDPPEAGLGVGGVSGAVGASGWGREIGRLVQRFGRGITAGM